MIKLVLTVVCAAVTACVWAEDPYVELTGRQSICTGFVPTPNSRFELDCEPTAVVGQARVLGAKYGASNGYYCQIYMNGSSEWAFNYNSTRIWQATGVKVASKRTQVVLDAKNRRLRITLDGTTYDKDACWNSMTDVPATSPVLYIAGKYGDNPTASMKIYSFRIYENDELVHDYGPALCNGFACLYDRIDGTIAMDADSFDSGKDMGYGGDIAEVSTPYVESAGGVGMNTRFHPGLDSRIEFDFALRGMKAQDRLFAADGGGTRPSVALYLSGDLKFSAGFGSNTWHNSRMPADLKRHRVVFDYPNRRMQVYTGVEANTNGLITPAEKYIVSGSTDVTENPLAMYSGNGAGGVVFGTSSRRPSMRVYGMKIYKADVLVHDYVPLVKGGVAGFRDRVDGAFITGEETDRFTAGGDVQRIPDDAYVALPYANDGHNKNDCTGEQQFILLDYLPGPNTRMEVDYAFLHNVTNDAVRSKKSNAIFGCYLSSVNDLPVERFYYEATPEFYSVVLGPDNVNNFLTENLNTSTAKDVRRTAVLDAKNNCGAMVTAGYTNFVVTPAHPLSRTSPSRTIRIGSIWDSPLGGAAPIRVYGCRIYENGEIVRNYVPYVKGGVPGLLDSMTADFATGDRYGTSGVTTNKLLSAGGTITGDADFSDAFIEFAGSQWVVTDYRPNGTTRIVADIQCARSNPAQQRFWYSDGGINNQLYMNGSQQWAFNYATNAVWQGTGISVGLWRTQIDFDAGNKVLTITVNGTTTDKSSLWSSMKGYDRQATGFLRIGGYALNGNPCASMKLYGFRIYDNGTLVREYVPYKSGGVVGLYELRTGTVLTNASGTGSLAIGGRAAALTVAPADTSVPVEGSATLHAFAAGAISYRWYLNGEEIAGEIADSLTLNWKRVKGRTETYSVRPVYSVFGEEVLGDASFCTVTHTRRGLVISVR